MRVLIVALQSPEASRGGDGVPAAASPSAAAPRSVRRHSSRVS